MIQICSCCGGKGEISNCERFDEHDIPCPKCKGSGRLYVKNYTLEVPYPIKNDFYSKDSAIIKILRS